MRDLYDFLEGAALSLVLIVIFLAIVLWIVPDLVLAMLGL